MDIKLPNEVLELMSKFTGAGYQIYVVGGAVRDLLLKRPVHDWDFTTDAKPEEILKLFHEGFSNNKFGTVGIPSDDQILEVTTMRKEGIYKDFRHPDSVSWTKKIEEDLARRDFTINTMALGQTNQRISESAKASPTTSEQSSQPVNQLTSSLILIDPFSGQADLEGSLIRAVGDPNKRFQEDALRLIRAIRIGAELGFDIEKETFASIKIQANLIAEIANERIRDELFKLLASTNPYMGIVKLREAGILQIVLPELERTFGIVQEGPKHDRIYDIGEHSLLSLKNTPSTDPIVRLAALLHDVGKSDTVSTASDGNVTFYNHDLVGGKIVRQIGKRFNMSKYQLEKLYSLLRWHLFTVDEKQTDAAIRRFIKNVGLENIPDIMAVRVGDRLGGGTATAVSWRMEEFLKRIDQVMQKPFSISDLKVTGNDVMKTLNIKPGRKVGEILQKLFKEIQADDSKNNKEYLLNRITQLQEQFYSKM